MRDLIHYITNNNYHDFNDNLKDLNPLNKKDSNGFTLLHIAAKYLRTNFIQALLDHGMDVDSLDKNKNTTLMSLLLFSRENDHKKSEIIQLLLENGANPNENSNQKSLAPLHVTRNSEIIQLLLKHKADSNLKDKKGHTALHYLVAEQTQIIEEEDLVYQYELLVSHGAKQNLLMENGYSILHSAIANQIYALIPKLIELKIGFSTSVTNIGTPLHLAIAYQEHSIVKDLIKNGIDINFQRDNDKWSPLIVASQANQYDIVKLLLKHGANKDLVDYKNKKAIDYTKNKEIIALLTTNNKA